MQNHMATAALLADEARSIYDNIYELKHADFIELKYTSTGHTDGILVINGEMVQTVKEALIDKYTLRYIALTQQVQDCIKAAVSPYELASLRQHPDESEYGSA